MVTMTDWRPTWGDPAKRAGFYTLVGPWRVEVLFPRDPDSPTGSGPAELHITLDQEADPRDGRRGITTGTLRDIPLTAVMEKMQRIRAMTLPTLADLPGSPREKAAITAMEHIREEITNRPSPGRAGRPELFYARVALAYSYRSVIASDPIAWLARQTGVEPRTAENWVRQARQRDMLTEPRPGVAGGQVTEKATNILNEQEPPTNG